MDGEVVLHVHAVANVGCAESVIGVRVVSITDVNWINRLLRLRTLRIVSATHLSIISIGSIVILVQPLRCLFAQFGVLSHFGSASGHWLIRWLHISSRRWL